MNKTDQEIQMTRALENVSFSMIKLAQVTDGAYESMLYYEQQKNNYFSKMFDLETFEVEFNENNDPNIELLFSLLNLTKKYAELLKSSKISILFKKAIDESINTVIKENNNYLPNNFYSEVAKLIKNKMKNVKLNHYSI